MKTIKAALYCLFVLIAVAAFCIWSFRSNALEARAQALSEPQPVPPVAAFLFQTPVIPVDQLNADLTERETLVSIFTTAQLALQAGMQAATNKTEFRRDIEAATIDELENFLALHSQSSWSPSLNNRMATWYRLHGQTTKAISHFEAAWEQTQVYEADPGKHEADIALAMWTRMLVHAGQIDLLSEIYRQHGTRILDRGPLSQMWLRTHERYLRIQKYPQHAFKCGIVAIGHVADALHISFPRGDLFRMPGKPEGFNLRELQDISSAYGFGLVAVRRNNSSSTIPIPSVIHWRQGHYAAILESTAHGFKIADVTAEGVTYLDADDINIEASGFFLVPTSLLGADFVLATAEQANSVRGKWVDCDPADPDDGACGQGDGGGGGGGGAGGGGIDNGCGKICQGIIGDQGGGGGDGGGDDCCDEDPSDAQNKPVKNPNKPVSARGMAHWRVSQPYLNLWLHDTPLYYQPAKGPAINLTVSFQQRNENDYDHFGFGWHCSFSSKAIDTFSGVLLCPPGGGFYTVPMDGSGTNGTLYKLNWSVDRYIDGDGYLTGIVARLPNGSQYKYFHYDATNAFYISELVDSSGNKLTYTYNSTNHAQLDSITDADSNVTTLEYLHVNPHNHLEIEVGAPNGQFATLVYNSDNLLTNIIDSAGISSSVTYDVNGTPTSLTTPYGTTYFTLDYVTGNYDRSAIVTLPTAGKHVWMLIDSANSTQIPTNTFASSQLPTNTPFATNSYLYGHLDVSNRQVGNTFHWNPAQFASCSTTNLADFVWADFKKSHIRHWLWDTNLTYHINTLGYEQLPSPDLDGTTEGQIVWYEYAGQEYGSPELHGSQIKPRVIATVMPDASTWWSWTERNSWGKGISVIEKWYAGADNFRTNTFSYSSDGIDLLEHRFKASGIDKLIAGYGYSNHQPSSMTNTLGEVATWTYNTDKQLVTYTNTSGMVSSNTYGGDSRVSKTVVYEAGIGPVSTNEYTWSGGNLRTHTDSRGLIITNTWDGLNRLTKVEFPDGSYIEHAYTNGAGTKLLDRTYTRDRMGNVTGWTYTPNRQIETVVDPNGSLTRYEYCDCGSLESVTRAYGTGLAEITDYFYDGQMRLREIDRPDGSLTTNAYDSVGRLTIVADVLGTTTNTYDNLGRTICASNVFGQVFAAAYDVEGNVTNRTDANGVTVSITYDDLDRLRTRRYPDGGVEAWGYAANVSEPTSYTNQLSKVTTYAYDKLGRKTGEVVVGLATNAFTFSAASDLLTFTDGSSHTTTWAYDLYGRIATKKYADGNTNLIYSYDANSRLTNRWSAAKGNTKYQYDANGNRVKIDYPNSADVLFAYDALNRPTQESVTNLFTSSFTYHPGGALKTEDGPWSSDTITYYTNTAGLRSGFSIQQPVGSFTNGYAYDAPHRVTNVTSHAGSFTYDYYPTNGGFTAPTPLIRKVTLPTASYITNSFDNNGRQTETRLMTSGNSELNDHAYVYNAGDQRIQHTYTDDSYVTYTYDDAGELRTAYTTNGSNIEIASQRYMYGYDEAWNMIKRTNNTTVASYTVNNLNQNTTSFSYDSNGNPSGNGTGVNYTFDDENRLITAVTTMSGANYAKSEFRYDARGRLRTKEEYSWNASSWTLTLSVRYVYDGMLVVQERNSGNTPQITYTRGPDLSGRFQGAGGIGGMLARSTSYQSGSGAWNTHQFYHADANGNVTYLMNAAETLAASYRYDPFGRTITSSGTSASANTYRFSSKELHSGSAPFYYYGFRFYDPNSQRWLNRDPLGEMGDQNLYRFVNNQPQNLFDPIGLDPSMFPPWDFPPPAPKSDANKECRDKCFDTLVNCLNGTEGQIGAGIGTVGGGAIGGHSTQGGNQKWLCRAGKATRYGRALGKGTALGFILSEAPIVTSCYSTYYGCVAGCENIDHPAAPPKFECKGCTPPPPGNSRQNAPPNLKLIL